MKTKIQNSTLKIFGYYPKPVILEVGVSCIELRKYCLKTYNKK